MSGGGQLNFGGLQRIRAVNKAVSLELEIDFRVRGFMA